MTINTKLFCNFVMSNRDWLTYWLSDFESSPLNGRFAISGTTFSLLKSVKILKIFYDASSYCSAILPFHLRREFFSFQKMFNVTYDPSSFRLTTLHLRREFFFSFFERFFLIYVACSFRLKKCWSSTYEASCLWLFLVTYDEISCLKKSS